MITPQMQPELLKRCQHNSKDLLYTFLRTESKGDRNKEVEHVFGRSQGL